MPCAVDRKRKARIEPEFRTAINHELFYFASPGALRKFTRDPLRYCGLLTDPVNRTRFRPTTRSPRLEHGGRPYYFSADSTIATFKAWPDSFAMRRGM